MANFTVFISVMFGIVSLCLGLRFLFKIIKHDGYTGRDRPWWMVEVGLIFFFIFGYTTFLITTFLIPEREIVSNILVSVIFLLGGFFVALTMFNAYRFIEDMREKKNLEIANQYLKYCSEHDDLTGLYLRRYFDESLRQAVNDYQKTGRKFSLIFIDINDFKNINDTCGHAAGDKVLKSIAKVLLGTFRKTDIVARLGGDEFAVIAKDVERRDMPLLLQRIKYKISFIYIKPDHRNAHISVSIGLYTANNKNIATDAIMNEVDQKCYHEKKMLHKNGKKPEVEKID